MVMALVSNSQQRRWTAADLREVPDDRNRYEIIDGDLFVTPAPSLRHQRLLAEFFFAIRTYLDAHRVGNVLFAPADVVLADDTVVEPDLFAFPLVDGPLPAQWDGSEGLLLAIEIISPSSARTDRTVKRMRYQRACVPEYWIIDGDARVVERWRSGDGRPQIVSDRLEWQPDPGFPALAVELESLFATALGAAG